MWKTWPLFVSIYKETNLYLFVFFYLQVLHWNENFLRFSFYVWFSIFCLLLLLLRLPHFFTYWFFFGLVISFWSNCFPFKSIYLSFSFLFPYIICLPMFFVRNHNGNIKFLFFFKQTKKVKYKLVKTACK